MNKKEELIKKILDSRYNNDVQSSFAEDSKFSGLIESLLTKRANTIPLSEATVEILDNILEPMEISKALSEQLSQTMLKAEEQRQYLRQMEYLVSQGLFGDYVNLLRKKQDVSLIDIALKLGVREYLLRQIESGKTEFIINVGPEKLLELGKLLRSPITDFIEIVKRASQSLVTSRSFSLAFGSPQQEKSQPPEKSIKKFLADFEKRAEAFTQNYNKLNSIPTKKS